MVRVPNFPRKLKEPDPLDEVEQMLSVDAERAREDREAVQRLVAEFKAWDEANPWPPKR